MHHEMIITVSLVNTNIDTKCKIKKVPVMKTQDLLSYQISYITYSIHIGCYDFAV